MDAIHKLLTTLTNPLMIGFAALVIAVVLTILRQARGLRNCLFALISIWLYLWSTPALTMWIGVPLERPYPPRAIADFPEADAICLLGGGMGAWQGGAEMWLSADRAWEAAKLWKAGKAKIITITGSEVQNSTLPLLQDFGVPTNAVVHITGAKNTEDEARLIRKTLGGMIAEQRPIKVLLATSAWHMRRAEMLFCRAGLEVIPAACDYEISARGLDRDVSIVDFLPSAETVYSNVYSWKEQFAYWCYKVKGYFE